VLFIHLVKHILLQKIQLHEEFSSVTVPIRKETTFAFIHLKVGYLKKQVTKKNYIAEGCKM